MTLPLLPLARARLRRPKAIAMAALAATLTIAGLAGAPAAQSAPDPSCPTAFPVSDLTKHLPVTGLTVSEGTTPEQFTGEVLGVLQDGIAPDLDMIMVRLTSPEIDRVGGIWAGMSGSPVYAPDGRLIGAVAYSLSFGPSPVAGVTPAADMQALLSAAPSDPAATATLQQADQADSTVDVPPAAARTLVASGAATQSEVADGFTQLATPLGVSGLASARRLGSVTKRLGLQGVHVYAAGSTSTESEDLPIVAGGNLAASISYGDLSAIGTGTATAVCGNEVLAFGHPMMFSGRSRLTIHGADALYIQDDNVFSPFKVSNAGAPVGRIDGDRLAGLHGVLGSTVVPKTAAVTSTVTATNNPPSGHNPRTGHTYISVPGQVPYVAAIHLLVDQDRVFDRIGAGSGKVSWQVEGVRENGEPFTYTRSDQFASRYDLTVAPAITLYRQLHSLFSNGAESIKITKVDTSSTLSNHYEAYRISSIEIRQAGVWHRLTRKTPVLVHPNTVRSFRVTLDSKALGTKRIVTSVHVPAGTGNRPGYLVVSGGGSRGLYGFYGGGGSTGSFDEALTKVIQAPHNDEVTVNLTFGRRGGPLTGEARQRTDAVVTGRHFFRVQSIRMMRHG